MADSGLDILERESDVAPDPAVRRGVGAILGASVLIVALMAGLGLAAAGVVAGFVWLVSTPAEYDAFRMNDVGCRVVGIDVLVDAVLLKAPDTSYPAFVAGYDWDPKSLQVSVDDAGAGDRVFFSATASRADDIRHLVLQIAAGEPAYQQTFDAQITVDGASCTAQLRAR